ncbi:MAG: hypothetical protein KDD67_03885 [Ignavibacteriae bacterium]|nr:hypothetical protein [Ignavibacteriota bacterium]MCB9215017.1 hypothetical protein [Ignavibacteria bacterium]
MENYSNQRNRTWKKWSFALLGTLLSSVLLATCSGITGENTISNGTITGPDYRRCVSPCCGGWFIEIEGETWRFLELPEGSGINLNVENLPMEVTLNWRVSDLQKEHACGSQVITVDAIKKR